jgi:acyl-CoA hydrolase/RimJ/RimL family protein N-acetyltransferase
MQRAGGGGTIAGPAEGWRGRVGSAAQAVSVVRPGDRVFVGSACATPVQLLDALERRTDGTAGVTLIHFLTDHVGSGDPPATHYRHRVFYVGADMRRLAGSAQVDYVPISLAEVPRLLSTGRLPLDVALVQVAPPDADGTCSLGVSVDVTRAAALAARTVIAEVNPAMPRTCGDSRIPVARIDRFVEVDTPVTEYLHPPVDGIAEQIARYVARLIGDRCTLQIGLGRVPNQMLAHLTNRRELAVHSDVITEPVVDLVQAGVITGPIVASWAMGTRRLYDLLDGDPRFALRPIEQVCDAGAIAANPRMVSVTQAFTVDLSGQVCTERLDGDLYGGISTGPDFHRGALMSSGGMAIVCLASRTPQGRPAIRVRLDPDEPVSIARADVHWVITEYGTAYLFGRSLAERAVALIEIAHPDDRAELLAAAVERRIVGRRQQLRSRTAYPVAEEREVRVRDGRDVRVRPTRTSDSGAMQALFHRLSEEDVRTRFFQNLKSLTDKAALHLCSVDYEEEMAFAAVVGPPEHERVVGTSSYYLNPATGLADVGYMVDPEWRGSGLAGILHARMVEYARARGIAGFSADVLAANRAMLRVFERTGDAVTVGPADEDGIREVTIRFAESEAEPALAPARSTR